MVYSQPWRYLSDALNKQHIPFSTKKCSTLLLTTAVNECTYTVLCIPYAWTINFAVYEFSWLVSALYCKKLTLETHSHNCNQLQSLVTIYVLREMALLIASYHMEMTHGSLLSWICTRIYPLSLMFDLTHMYILCAGPLPNSTPRTHFMINQNLFSRTEQIYHVSLNC